MMKTTERLNLILTLNQFGVDLGLLKDFSPDNLLWLCNNLKERQTPQTWYKECTGIQKELLSDERFFFYLSKLSAFNQPMKTIDTFIKVIHSHGESPLNYPIGRLISSMAVSNGANEVFYDYLKNFSGLPTDKEQKKVIIKNLCLYRESFSKPIEELSDDERSLFMEPCLTNRNLIPNEVGGALGLLAQHQGLIEIIRIFYKNKWGMNLSMENYEIFSQASDRILGNLKMLQKLLDTEGIKMLVLRWLENNSPVYDLDVLCKKLKDLGGDKLEDVLYSRSGYLNLIYGGKVNNIPLSEVPKHKEDILIYAITNKKNSFIRLVEENYKTFTAISSQSILFSREFYTKYINLNSLSASNLLDCGRMDAGKMLFSALEPDRLYTFKEIQALYGLPEQYLKLYAGLQIPGVDGCLIAFKQLSKQKLLATVTEEEHIRRLAEAFSQKPLSKWREQEFAHIAGLKPQDAVGLLIRRVEVEQLIPQMKTKTDVNLVVRNWSNSQNCNTIDEMKKELIKVDNAWGELALKMGFSDAFLRHNQERVIEFLCKDGAEIAKTYYNSLSGDNQRESMKRIVKAELMGEFETLKYYADDLSKEIDFPITSTQKSVWMENTNMFEAEILVKECDDFYNTMLIGTVPQRTCLSYINGQYNECLLSSFDSNKKVIYADINGIVVGRAIVRLTKGRFSNPEKMKDEAATSLSFVDLETQRVSEPKKEDVSEKERLVLFLERSYSAGISDEAAEFIRGMYVDLMVKKAEFMGAMLVISNSYEKISRTDFTRTLFHIYISKSKAGAQYLDSLNGSAKVSDEGGYRANNFYIRKDDILKGGI